MGNVNNICAKSKKYMQIKIKIRADNHENMQNSETKFI